jgi:hypothetical protein
MATILGMAAEPRAGNNECSRPERGLTVNRLLRPALVGLATAAAILIGPNVANADPKGEVVPLVCDNGLAIDVAVSGNGLWTPGHDTDSTAMLIPVSFGEFTGTITDEEGNVVETFTDPPATRGQSTKAPRDYITCTFTFSDTFEDPELGLLTFEGSGSVTGFVTPAD